MCFSLLPAVFSCLDLFSLCNGLETYAWSAAAGDVLASQSSLLLGACSLRSTWVDLVPLLAVRRGTTYYLSVKLYACMHIFASLIHHQLNKALFGFYLHIYVLI